jgi:aspartyl protease family protein
MVRAALMFVAVVGFLASVLTGIEKRMTSDVPMANPVITVENPQEQTGGLSSLSASSGLNEEISLQRQPDGHFYVDAEVNGAKVHMLVDTGATAIALTREDARKAGIGISIGMPNVIGQGASGDVKGEFVTVDRIKLGDKTGESMNAVVLDGGGMSLLGQTFLSKFSSVEIHGDTMVLR